MCAEQRMSRWPSQKSLKGLREKVWGVVHRGRNGVCNIRDLGQEVNPILRGWANYFRSGNATRQFEQAEKCVWERLARFECKLRKRTAQYRNSKYDYDWFRSLGAEPLVGTIRCPGPSLVLAKAKARTILCKTDDLKGHVRFEREV